MSLIYKYCNASEAQAVREINFVAVTYCSDLFESPTEGGCGKNKMQQLIKYLCIQSTKDGVNIPSVICSLFQ